MFTRNYDLMTKAFLRNGGQTGETFWSMYNEHSFNVSGGNSMVEYMTPFRSNGFSRWQVGSGSTPESVNDSRLASPHEGGFTGINNITITDIVENNNAGVLITMVATNTSSEDKTVREFGYFRTAETSTTSFNKNTTALVYRHVFDQDIIVPPQSSINVTMKVIFHTN